MSHVDFEYDSDSEDDCQDIDEIWYALYIIFYCFVDRAPITNVLLGSLVDMVMLVEYVTPFRSASLLNPRHHR